MSGGFDYGQSYVERVYAGVLGKIVGVYLGRPFEGWTYEQIESKFGQIDGYVHEQLGVPLVVSDDDISGTFTFIRALSDRGNPTELTAAAIGESWLNYIIEKRTILWWGGMGVSTEHTAFQRLKSGVSAPMSGSIERNGRIVAEQIGAQIFIDAWGLVNPGDPERAAHFAGLAGSVSHDGTAVDCAKVVAAMVAAAFVSSNIEDLLNIGTGVISGESLVSNLIDDVRNWHAKGLSWRDGFLEIKSKYGYDRYGGGCHTIPNHALIIHGLLHGGGDFDRSLMVANSCGWDTDCNSGNVGCIVGVLGGLDGIKLRWRDPVGDRILLPTADGGRTITDAATEAIAVANSGRELHGLKAEFPKKGARFHFALPGSVQGFVGSEGNVDGRLRVSGRAITATFVTPEDRKSPGYSIVASPTLYPGQTVAAQLIAEMDAHVQIVIGYFDAAGQITTMQSEPQLVAGGDRQKIEWRIPDLAGNAISEVGIETRPDESILLDSLTWEGEPTLRLAREDRPDWCDQWVNGVDDWLTWGSAFRLVQNEGTGLLLIGTREWRNYRVDSTITANLAEEFGVVVRAQGMRRYYGLLATTDQQLRLVCECDGRRILSEVNLVWEVGQAMNFALEVQNDMIVGSVNGVEVRAIDGLLTGGAAGYLIKEGRIDSDEMAITGFPIHHRQ